MHERFLLIDLFRCLEQESEPTGHIDCRALVDFILLRIRDISEESVKVKANHPYDPTVLRMAQSAVEDSSVIICLDHVMAFETAKGVIQMISDCCSCCNKVIKQATTSIIYKGQPIENKLMNKVQLLFDYA